MPAAPSWMTAGAAASLPFDGNRSMRETDRIALVTGGTHGIGRETVRQLAEAGVHTILACRNREGALETAREFQASGLPVVAVPLDVTSHSAISAVADAVQRRHGHLDILINSAGAVCEADDEAGSPTFDAFLQGLIAVTQAFLPLLHRSIDGCIINVAAGADATPPPAPSQLVSRTEPCRGAKSAINAWTMHLVHELRGTNVRVHSVIPGKTSAGAIDVAEGARASVKLALFSAVV